MKALVTALLGAAIFGAAVLPIRTAARPAPALVALNRCGPQNIDDYTTTVRNAEAHPPRGGQAAEFKRFKKLQGVIAGLGQERGILAAVCPQNVDRTAFNAEIAAAQAWAMALEADIATALGPPCPSAAGAVERQFLAGAWYTLAFEVTAEGGTPRPVIAAVIPKVQSRAAKVNLTLPSFADTSAYWRDQVKAATTASLQACATPSPAPAATAAPSASPSARPIDTPPPLPPNPNAIATPATEPTPTGLRRAR